MKDLLSGTQKIKFANGFTLLLTPIDESALVSFNLCLGMGNLYEEEGERGLSSLMQEVITKGTGLKKAEELATSLESLGASFDASAGYFAGRVHLVGPAENCGEILPLFFEIVLDPAFREEETVKEKLYLQNLIRSQDDEPLKAATIRFQKAFYGSHPFSISPLGVIEDLDRLSSARLREWHTTIYQPANMVVSVAGHFQPEKVTQAFELAFSSLPSGVKPIPKKHNHCCVIPECLERRSLRDCWLVYGIPAPPLQEPRARSAFEILNTALGGGLFSRLFLRLREERGWSYHVGSLYVPLCGPSFFCSFAGFLPRHFRDVQDLLRREIEGMGSIDSQEFQEAKNYTLGTYLTQFEGVQSLAALLAFYEKIGLGWDHILTYETILRQMTLEEAIREFRIYQGQNGAMGGIVPWDWEGSLVGEIF